MVLVTDYSIISWDPPLETLWELEVSKNFILHHQHLNCFPHENNPFAHSDPVKMLSLRCVARAVPRSVFRASASTSLRPLSTISKPSFLQSSWRPAQGRSFPAFSTSLPRREPAGECMEFCCLQNEQGLTYLCRSRSRACSEA
jgi:hypothetical protein